MDLIAAYKLKKKNAQTQYCDVKNKMAYIFLNKINKTYTVGLFVFEEYQFSWISLEQANHEINYIY